MAESDQYEPAWTTHPTGYMHPGFENFKLLQAGVSQQIIRVATQSFKSYLGLKRLADKDFLPEYEFRNKVEYAFSGRRVKRGLYRAKNRCIHADINGAANIIRKYRSDVDFSVLDKGIFLNPHRVRVLNTARKKPVVQKSKAVA